MISKAASRELKEQVKEHTVDEDSHASGQEPHLAPARQTETADQDLLAGWKGSLSSIVLYESTGGA